MRPVLLDLDGPLLDVSERYYRVHRHVVHMLGGSADLDLEDFWAAKRSGKGSRELAEMEGMPDRARAYLDAWLDHIEQEESLLRDRIQEGALEALRTLASRVPVVLVTLRQERRGLEGQLARLGILPHLSKVLVGDPLDGAGEETKHRLIGETGLPTRGAWMVGDTEVDVRAARRLGARAAAVTCGIRKGELLRRESPDLLLPNLASFAASEGTR